MVVEGSLEVSQTASAGKRHIATCLEPGQLMNLIPVVDDQPALHDAYAHETARLLLIPKPMFIELMDQEPQVARRIAQLLCRRSRGLYESLSDQALRSLRERCARVLLGLLDAYGRPGEGGTSISLKLSQEDFADMLGCSRQSANRELKQLARDGIIEMTYSSLRVVDEPALRAVALS